MFRAMHPHGAPGSPGSLLSGMPALKALFAQDVEHGTEYVRTLRVYLAHASNAAQAAAHLYIHRHTLDNRLEKIRKISGLDVRRYYTRLYLSLALLLHDLFAV